MKHSLAIVFMLVSGIVPSAIAQTPSAPAAPAVPTKVAVIAFQTAVGQTNEFQRNFADLQKKYEPKRTQLKAMADEIDGLQKQLQAQGDKLSDAERASRAKVIDDKQKSAQRLAEDARNDLQGEMQEIYNGVAGKVFDTLTKYSQQQGYTLVLDVSEQQNPVLYATDSTNITKPIIDAYNIKSGVPAPPPPAPGSAPAPTSTRPSAPSATRPPASTTPH